jgi:hypothetical protein
MLFAYAAAQVKSAPVGQHYVQQSKADAFLIDADKRIGGGVCLCDRVSLVFEVQLDQIGNLALIVDYEYAFGQIRSASFAAKYMQTVV